MTLIYNLSKLAVAIDMNQVQSALLELKLAAIRCLCHQDFLILLGETEDQQQKWQENFSV